MGRCGGRIGQNPDFSTLFSTRNSSGKPAESEQTLTTLLMQSTIHVYEVRPRKDKRGVDLISDALPFGGLWYAGPNAVSNAIDYAKFFSRSHNAVIRVYDEAGQRDRDARAQGRFQRPGAAIALVLIQVLHEVRLTRSTGRALVIFLLVCRAPFRVDLRLQIVNPHPNRVFI
jgi:hypothetical protein